MFERVMITLDGSKFAEAVLPLAAAIARACGASVLLTRAAPAGLYLGAEYASADGSLIASAEQYLAEVANRPVLDGLWVNTSVAGGAPADVIVNEAHRRGVDLVAMATHGRGGVARMTLGSVADEVLHSFAGSLLVVRPDVRLLPMDGQPKRIVIPLDGSALAARAIDVAAELAKRIDAELVLTVVLGLPEPVVADDHRVIIHIDELIAGDRLITEEYLSGLAGDLHRRGLRASWEIRLGEVTPEIRAVAQAVPGSMVVMTTHGRSGLDRILLGSIADEVVRSSNVPVLMRRPAEATPAPRHRSLDRYEALVGAR